MIQVIIPRIHQAQLCTAHVLGTATQGSMSCLQSSLNRPKTWSLHSCQTQFDTCTETSPRPGRKRKLKLTVNPQVEAGPELMVFLLLPLDARIISMCLHSWLTGPIYRVWLASCFEGPCRQGSWILVTFSIFLRAAECGPQGHDDPLLGLSLLRCLSPFLTGRSISCSPRKTSCCGLSWRS